MIVARTQDASTKSAVSNVDAIRAFLAMELTVRLDFSMGESNEIV